MPISKLIKLKKREKILFWTALVTSWLAFFLSSLIPLAFLFWIAVLIYLFIKRTKLKWYLLLVSSWTLASLYSFISGTKDYFQGKATIKTYGLPDAEFWNLDHELRVWHSTSGCAVMGNEIFTQTPNNIAVNLWTKLLGIQPHVYKGYYPTKQEVNSELSLNYSRLKFKKEFKSITFDLNGETITLKNVGSRGLLLRKNIDSAKVLLLKNDCLIFQALGDTTKTETILASKKTGLIFARYYSYQTR